MQPPLYSPPKTITAGFTSSQESEVRLSVSPFLWSSSISRAMKSCSNYMPLIFSPLKVSFLVIRRGKQGRGQYYFPSLLTWQSICRFVFLTCGFICESKYITSNIRFGQDRSWRENDTFSWYFTDQKKLNNGCNFSGIRSKWCGKRDQMMTDKINYVQQDQ